MFGNLNHYSIFIPKVPLRMMSMDILPSILGLGRVSDLFQPFLMYGDS